MYLPKFPLLQRTFRRSPGGVLWSPERYIERGPSGGGAPVDFDNTPNANGTYVDGSTNEMVVGTGSSGTTGNTLVDKTTAQTLTNKTLTSPVITTPTITSPVINGATGLGQVVAQQALFTENASSLTHTATFVIPAGATLLDIFVTPEVLWTAGGTAAFTCGDANAANGWFLSTNLKATDLILGERLQASNASYWGGLNGAYLVAATGRFGQQSANMIGGYCPNAYSVIGVVTVTGPSTTAGRTRMTVLYTIGSAVTPVLV